MLFALRQNYGYQFHEVEGLYPYERDIYVALLTEWLKDREEEARDRGQR